MKQADPDDRRDDAKRVVEALADLFDALPPADRAGAEEELRADGIAAQRVGARIARTAAGMLPGRGPEQHLVARPSRRLATAAGQAEPPLRRGRVGVRTAALTGALAAAAALAWVVWRPQPDPIVRRMPAPSGAWSVPQRPAEPRLEHAHRESDVDTVVGAAPAPPDVRSGAAPIDAPPDGGAESAPAVIAGGSASQRVENAPHDTVGASGAEAWVLDRDSWEQLRFKLPPPVLERVKQGKYWFTVLAVEEAALAAQYSEGFRHATQANLGRYAVDADTCGLRDLLAGGRPTALFGLPFPDVDLESSGAACEIMWNVEAVKELGGGQEATLAIEQRDARAGAAKAQLEMWLRTTAYLSRATALFNPEQVRWAQLERVKDASAATHTWSLTRRSNDPVTRDKVWSYLPAIRRVRAVSPANRSDGVAGLDLGLDAFGCFDGKLEDFEWRFVGSQTVLASMTGITPNLQTYRSPTRAEVVLPATKTAAERHDTIPESWLLVEGMVMVPRPMWIVEGTPRDKYYLFGRLQLYVDATLYRPYWLLGYSWKGELLKDVMCTQHWSRSADATLVAANATAMTAVDGARAQATLARYRELQLDWGRPEESLYTVATMVSDAH
jgi:hypothetical protein